MSDTQLATLPPWEDERRATFVAALRRGNVDDLLYAFLGNQAVLTQPMRDLAKYIIEVKRQNVAVLGNYEAFVRHTDRGDLGQVVAGVRLSMHDGTLVQIPDRRAKFVQGTDREWQWPMDKGKYFDWRDVFSRPDQALVSYTGYLKMNAVAGCSTQQPATVVVDGRIVENPYVQRTDEGDIERIVIQCNVAGPAPLTGNVVVVQYTLDLDPRRDLQHMLSNILRKRPIKKDDDKKDDDKKDDDNDAPGHAAVKLMHRLAFTAWVKDQTSPWEWHWTPVHGGVGYAHNLSHPEVTYAYDKFIGIMENAFKKAQTVARRNAMKAHPALSTQKVQLRDDGTATVAITGWAGGDGVLDHYARALDRVTTREVDATVEVIEVNEVYDPEQHRTGERELDPSEEVEEESLGVGLDPESALRNQSMAALDELVASGDLSPRQISRIGYPPPPDATLDDLDAMLDAARVLAASEE